MATGLSACKEGLAVVPGNVASVVAGTVPCLAGVQIVARTVSGVAGIEAVAGAVSGLAGIHAVAVVVAAVIAAVPADVGIELVGALELGVEFLALAGGCA